MAQGGYEHHISDLDIKQLRAFSNVKWVWMEQQLIKDFSNIDVVYGQVYEKRVWLYKREQKPLYKELEKTVNEYETI